MILLSRNSEPNFKLNGVNVTWSRHLRRTYCLVIQASHYRDVAVHGGDPEGGTGGPDPSPLKNHKNIGFLCNTGPDPLKNHKATKAAFNVGPSSAR